MNTRSGYVGLRATVALLVAVAAFALAAWGALRAPTSQPGTGATTGAAGLLERLDTTRELHAGYGVYPPYTQENPTTKEVTGFSVDLLQQIAREINAKLVLHRLNWNTMAADLKRGEYDVIADPIFQTVPRGREFAFTQPYAYFADGIAVVRASERRFTTFESLDSAGVRIAVGQGWASETLVRSKFSKASIQAVQTSTDLLQVFNEVLAGRADVAVADEADAQRFAKEHPTEVRLLFTEAPPAFMPAGFALRPNDHAGAEFLNVALRNLEATGVLENLAKRYGVVIRANRGGS